jgi:phage terminase large subunit-like protein
VLSPFTQSDQVSTVRRLAICADVYDISTTGGEFFANGILVHNCDEIAAYPDPKAVWDLLLPGLRLGRNPRRIVSTTPKPLKFLHDLIADPGTRVSRQRTWDNRANLPDAYIAELQRIYGGTRIGRQELEGELLDEAEGALWRRARLDDLRVRTAPELVRVVVAIDPAVTSGENSDESGIVAAGMDAVGDGYVLADKSCRLPPDQWASRAISLFDALSGDRIIAETNNGGDLVESVLRTIRRSISYEKITASRGKVVRAEPVAALYEQGRVHHVGAFPELEDEMVNFVPGQLAKSPNRADALVWALSWLLLRPRSQGRALWVG